MSYFNRPWRDQGDSSSSSSATEAAALAAEWKTLENRLSECGAAGLSGLRVEVNDFLRQWSVKIAQRPASEQQALDRLLNLASGGLRDQLELLDRQVQAQTADAAQRAVTANQRKLADNARLDREQADAREKIARLNRETDEIYARIRESDRIASDNNNRLQKAALFPENHCPVCSQPYLAMTGGCWHCRPGQRPSNF